MWRSSTVQLRSMELLAIGGKEKESQVDPKRAHLRKETIDRALLLRSRSIASPFLHRLLYPSLSFPLSLSPFFLSLSFFLFFSFLFSIFSTRACCGYVGNGNGVTLFFTSLRTIPNAGTSSKLRIGTELPFVSPLLVHRHAATINPLDVWNKRKRRILEARLAVKLLSSVREPACTYRRYVTFVVTFCSYVSLT